MNFKHVSFVINHNNIKVNELNHIRNIIENYNYKYKIDHDVNIIDYKLIRFYDINLEELNTLIINLNNLFIELFDQKLNIVGLSINGFYLPIDMLDYFLKKRNNYVELLKLFNSVCVNECYSRIYILFNMLLYRKIKQWVIINKIMVRLKTIKCLQ